MSIVAIKNHIVFRFVDPVNSKGEFEEATTKSGFIIKGGFDKSAKLPRWANVISVGNSCEHIKVGDVILIPALRWTEGIKHEDLFYWKTDETQVVGYKRGDDFTVINTHVLFTPIKEAVTRHASGLMVVRNQPDNTPHGTVVFMCKECEPELAGATIYYDSANFFNEFAIDEIGLSFIKQDDIWAYTPTGE